MSDDKPPYAKNNGSTIDVVGTDGGEVKTDFWPSDATDRSELNKKQIAVIEAAVRGDWESGAQLSRTLFDTEDPDEPARTYANNVLSTHCSRLLEEIKDGGNDRHENGKEPKTEDRTDNTPDRDRQPATPTTAEREAGSRLKTAVVVLVAFALGWVVGR